LEAKLWLGPGASRGTGEGRSVVPARRGGAVGEQEGATVRRRLPVLRSVSHVTALKQRTRTIESPGRAQDGLDDAHDALEPLFDVGILDLHRLLLAQHHLEVVVRLLALEVSYALIEPVDLVLGALADRALGLAVVCALPGKLLGREVGDAAPMGHLLALLVRLVILRLLAVPDGRRWCICLGWRRHADGGRVMDDSAARERIDRPSHLH
jgi:hypothetical protein